jgi:hypothetical protein
MVMRLHLYLLQIRSEHYDEVHEYDEVRSAIVAAATPRQARELLSKARSDRLDQNAEAWATPRLTSISWIGEALPRIKAGPVLLDIHEG